jgi:pSer/pThr/pTyr-binding forkhead associated (FHA) protein
VPDGGVPAEGTVDQPFVLVGRDDACDVTLTDPGVNLRHAWFQVVGGRVFAVDLGSRTGLVWPDGQSGSGWLDVGTPVRVGPFHLRLRSPASDRPAPFPLQYNPLQSDPQLTRVCPAVTLEFRNGRRAQDRWAVNRLITLLGRAAECKVHLNADDVSQFHCGLVLTPVGLWVVDLSGQGVVVNGERMRVARLRHGADLVIGRFEIAIHAPDPPPRRRPNSSRQPKPADHDRRTPTKPSGPPPVPEDEVPIGEPPPPDPAVGLPSSHIMADAFVVRGGKTGPGGPISGTLLVCRSNPPPGVAPVEPAESELPTAHPPVPQPPGEPHPAVLELLRQLSAIHSQLFDQFQQSMLVLVRMFGQMHREQAAATHEELARIQELNAELGKLQAEVARLTMAQAFGPQPDGPTASDPTPLPHEAPPPLPHAGSSETAEEAIQAWVRERIDTLQRERQSRWDKLVGLFQKPPE